MVSVAFRATLHCSIRTSLSVSSSHDDIINAVPSGRKPPVEGEPIQRGEGVVVLVLSGPAIGAWKDGGEQWKAKSSRLITAKLQLSKKKHGILHVLSC